MNYRLEIGSFFSVKVNQVSFSFDKILSDNNGLLVFQNVLFSHQDYYNITFLIACQETHSSYPVLNTVF